MTKARIMGISGLKTISQAIEYIQDCNVDLFRNKITGTGGRYNRANLPTGTVISIDGTANIVAYEVYKDGNLFHVDIHKSFPVSDPGDGVITVKAVDSNGTRFDLQRITGK